jgi:hypothetical protein
MSVDQRPSFIDYLKVANPWLFSHHPHSSCFRDHVWEFNGFYLCKGCVVTSGGFLAGVVLQLGTDWLSLFSEEIVGLIFIALLLPTVGTSVLGAARGLKHVARFFLGILMVSALFLLFITDRWDVRLIVAATYLSVKFVLERVREKQNNALLERCA